MDQLLTIHPESTPARPWPAWACWIVSAILLFHMAALLVRAAADQMVFSPLEADLDRWLGWYVLLINQDFANAYYSPNPDDETPILKAQLEFADGRPDQEIRIPDRSVQPHIRYLRQIALAWHLTHELKDVGSFQYSYWARSYAKHLCRAHPGCSRVTLTVEKHRAPELSTVIEAASEGRTIDLDDEDLYDLPSWTGAYSCDEF
jgi:hypothetical protein